jgi:hypothetical protein
VRLGLKFSYFLIGIYLICFSIALPAYAGWSENMRLTYRGNEINPQIIARNDTIHVAWNQSGTGYVSYIRSTDGGATWDSLVNLNAAGHWGQYSNLNLAENGLLVSWFDYNRDEGISSIAISKSVNGANWTAPNYVYTDNPNRFGSPVSTVKGDSIFLVYYGNRNDSTGLLPFRSISSYDYGQNWNDELTIGHPYVGPTVPVNLRYCNGTLLFIWDGAPDSSLQAEVHVFGYRSTDAGRSWSDTIWISPNIRPWAQESCISCNSLMDKFAISWMDYRYQVYAFHGDIFTSISNDGGMAWPFETMVSTTHTANSPTINYCQDTLISIWSDMRYYSEGWHELVYNRSNDNGISWEGETRITYTRGESYAPWISSDRGTIAVAWVEDVDSSGYEIYFKRYIPDTTAIWGNDIFVPDAFKIIAYPNPFNSNLTISVESQTEGFLLVYDIQGRIIRQFPYEKGEHRIVWDATNEDNQPVTSGTYFIGRKGDKSSTIKAIYLK